MLTGRSIALCVTGSVAAVDCVAIGRGIMRHGAEVFCVMSKMAQKIVKVEQDGKMGPVTTAAINETPGFVDKFIKARMLVALGLCLCANFCLTGVETGFTL